MSKTVTAKPGQNVYDMAIQHYGDVSAAIEFSQLNNLTLDADLIPGASYQIDDTAVKNGKIVQFFADKKYTVPTEDSFTIGETSLLTLTLKTILNETSGGDGYAEVEAIGGKPSYKYYWSNGQTGPALQNVSAGSYEVVVEDKSGQTAKMEVVISVGDSNIYLIDEEGNYVEDADGNRIILE